MLYSRTKIFIESGMSPPALSDLARTRIRLIFGIH